MFTDNPSGGVFGIGHFCAWNETKRENSLQNNQHPSWSLGRLSRQMMLTRGEESGPKAQGRGDWDFMFPGCNCQVKAACGSWRRSVGSWQTRLGVHKQPSTKERTDAGQERASNQSPSPSPSPSPRGHEKPQAERNGLPRAVQLNAWKENSGGPSHREGRTAGPFLDVWLKCFMPVSLGLCDCVTV